MSLDCHWTKSHQNVPLWSVLSIQQRKSATCYNYLLGKRATSRQLQWINCQLDYGGPNTWVHPKSLQRITGYSSSIGITAPPAC